MWLTFTSYTTEYRYSTDTVAFSHIEIIIDSLLMVYSFYLPIDSKAFPFKHSKKTSFQKLYHEAVCIERKLKSLSFPRINLLF